MARYRVNSKRLSWAVGKIVDEAAFDGPVQVARLVAGGFLEPAEDPANRRRANEGGAAVALAVANPDSSESEQDRDAE